MIPIKDDHDDSKRPTWRLRKARRPSWTWRADQHAEGDLPVFLVNPDQPMFSGKDAEYVHANRRKSFALAPRQLQLELHARYVASKERMTALRQRARLSSVNFANAKFQGELARFGLIMLVLPLVLLFMSDRSLRPEKKTVTTSAPQSIPKFEIDDRLAFAENLRDQFVSRGIASSFENAPSQNSENNQRAAPIEQTTTQQRPSKTDANLDALMPSSDAPAPTATDDRQWRLPFDSKTYVPSALPTTAEGSFRAEIAMSELMNERIRVAANNISDDAPPPVMKRTVQKRKKAIAQKRRPQSPSQMTASAATPPVAAPQQPNLPPPPILFFLGAPPPQPAQTPQ